MDTTKRYSKSALRRATDKAFAEAPDQQEWLETWTTRYHTDGTWSFVRR